MKIENLIKAVDEFLRISKQEFTTPVEINEYLDRKGILKDSQSRPGKPFRDLLRKGYFPHAYQEGRRWVIPASGANSKLHTNLYKDKVNSPKINQKRNKNKEHKLQPITELIIRLLKERYGENSKFYFEYKPEWLFSFPPIEVIDKYPQIAETYESLVEEKYRLKDRYELLTIRNKSQKQSYDIWIGEPFNFAVEFDEKQHFNQFRKRTLKHYDGVKVNYPVEFYQKLNRDAIINPGKSGFTKLKSNDPLFPYFLEGEKQDNRIRQRAFRDYLKDILPVVNGYSPIIRIPYQITQYKIKDFNESDLANIRQYILSQDLIEL